MPVFDTSQTMMAGSAAQAGAGVDVGTYTGKSCIFTGTNEFLTKTWGAAATDLDKFTISMWIKRNNVDSGSSQYWLFGAQTGAESNIKIQADKINVHLTGSNYDFVGTRLLRDTTNWYHLVFRYDSDESAAGDRFKCYINGELETWASSSTIPSGQDNEFLANTNKMTIGAYDASNHRFNGYIAQCIAIDGQSLGPEIFAHESPDTANWVMEEPPVAEMVASGGTESQDGQFKVHKFTADGTLTVTQAGLIEYLVVGGGGSGGSSQNAAGGGGGAGAFRTGQLQVPAGSYSITVGDGGAQSGTTGYGNDGSASVLHTITSAGGGGGGYGAVAGRASPGNGSGGGTGYSGSGGSGGDYGNDGGAGGGGSGKYGAGGGGGASAAGAGGSTSAGGNGGAGTASLITGSSVTYAGGGGGSTAYGGTAGTASGGGGAGGAENTNGSAATVNTGGGGGGAGGVNATRGGAGGSGIVVVRYFNPSSFDFGDNGFLLEFKETGTGTASSSTIGADTSGETNHFTSTNLASTDSARPDTPVDNHPTWNVIGTATPGAASVTFAEGNRQFQTPDGNGQNVGVSSVAFDAANDTFVEFLVDAKGSSTAGSIGILPEDEFTIYGYSQPSLYGGGGSTGAHCYIVDGNKSLAGATNASYGNTYDTGDRIGMRINAGSLFFYKNGTIQNSGTAATTGITGKWLFAVSGDYGFDVTVRVNSGDWTDAPSGMTSSNQISSAYLPDLEIGQESDDLATNHYNTILYTGNTTTPRTISGVGFEPGITLIKGRSVAGAGLFFDDVRGAGSNKQLSLSNEDEEGTDGSYNSASYGFLSAFNADGFVLTDGSSNGNWVNENGTTFASYNWRLGTAHSGTTSGSGDDESYSAQVNTDAGIGLVAYEGNGTSGHTIPHNLSKAPEFIVARRRTPDNAWFVFHTGVASDPETDYLVFDTNAAVADQTAMWNDTAPSSTMITVGDSSGTNTDGNNYIMWYMHSVDGFSKFGAYRGNNNAGGPFVYCGFRPAMVITRRTDSGDHWRLIDNKRHPVNDGSAPGFKLNDAENESDSGNRNMDFVSNGFKVRETDPDSNADGGNYVYMAFAATPFKYSNAY